MGIPVMVFKTYQGLMANQKLEKGAHQLVQGNHSIEIVLIAKLNDIIVIPMKLFNINITLSILRGSSQTRSIQGGDEDYDQDLPSFNSNQRQARPQKFLKRRHSSMSLVELKFDMKEQIEENSLKASVPNSVSVPKCTPENNVVLCSFKNYTPEHFAECVMHI